MTHIKAKVKTNQDEPATLHTGVAPATTEDVLPEVSIHGKVQRLSGKDTEFSKVDNCPSQLDFGRFGGTEERSPPSGEYCGVSVSAKPAGKKAKPAEPTTPAPGGMDSKKWASAED